MGKEHERKVSLIDSVNDIKELDRFILGHTNVNDYLKGLYRKGKVQILLRKQYVEEFINTNCS